MVTRNETARISHIPGASAPKTPDAHSSPTVSRRALIGGGSVIGVGLVGSALTPQAEPVRNLFQTIINFRRRNTNEFQGIVASDPTPTPVQLHPFNDQPAIEVVATEEPTAHVQLQAYDTQPTVAIETPNARRGEVTGPFTSAYHGFSLELPEGAIVGDREDGVSITGFLSSGRPYTIDISRGWIAQTRSVVDAGFEVKDELRNKAPLDPETEKPLKPEIDDELLIDNQKAYEAISLVNNNENPYDGESYEFRLLIKKTTDDPESDDLLDIASRGITLEDRDGFENGPWTAVKGLNFA